MIVGDKETIEYESLGVDSMLAIFFLGAAFGISAMGFIELSFVACKMKRIPTRMILDMIFDVMVILLILHLVKMITI